MKVWACGVGRVDRLIAAPTQKAAAAAFAMSPQTLRKYGGVTSNEAKIALAMSQPGVPFMRPHGGPISERVYRAVTWKEMARHAW